MDIVNSNSNSLFHSPVDSYCGYSSLRKTLRPQNDQLYYQKHVIVFGLVWIIADDSNSYYLACCTSFGEVVIWSVESSGTGSSKPMVRRQLNCGRLYRIKVETIDTKRCLMVCGDGGVVVLDWDNDILQQQSIINKKEWTPLARFQPHPSPTGPVEVNDFQVVTSSNGPSFLLGAAGDAFGIYKWNLTTGQLVTNYHQKDCTSTNSIAPQTLQVLPTTDTLLVGGEGGQVHLWDVRRDQFMESVDLKCTANAVNNSSTKSGLTRLGSNSKRKASRHVTTMCASDANWFTVGGGSSSNTAASSNKGFLATYHAPSRSLVSWVDTRETPLEITPHPLTGNLICAANEGVVRTYNALSLSGGEDDTTTTTNRHQWCTSPCSYAVAVASDGSFTAVAGVGCYVDVLDKDGEKYQRLEIC